MSKYCTDFEDDSFLTVVLNEEILNEIEITEDDYKEEDEFERKQNLINIYLEIDDYTKKFCGPDLTVGLFSDFMELID